MLRGVFNSGAGSGGGLPGVKAPGVIAQSAVPASVTGTLTETTLATIQLPALGPNSQIRIWTDHTVTNNANTKSVTARIAGTSVGAYNLASNLTSTLLRKITNRNATNSQLCTPPTQGSSVSTSTSAFLTTAIPTGVATTLTLTGTLGTTTDTITLESYTVEIINP